MTTWVALLVMLHGAPVAPHAPGRTLPARATRHLPVPAPDTFDGRVWTSTTYTVSQPLNVEWGYGQVGAQVDAEQLWGTPVGLHVDGFLQQRMYDRPLRLGPRSLFGAEPWAGDGGTVHPRYFTYDRLTEANVSVKTKHGDLFAGRTILPGAFQAMVDGVAGNVVIPGWGRVGAWAGLMPELWHPRMWLDRDYRSLSGFFPGDGSSAFTAEPAKEQLTFITRMPLAPVTGLLDGQTLFNLHYATAGASFSTRFPKFTSDTSFQLILWNPAAVYSVTDDGIPRGPVDVGLDAATPVRIIDAALINNLFTAKPLGPLNMHLRTSWDAWGALRALDATRVDPSGNPASVLQHPVQFTDPLVDNTFGVREALADVTFRGDWPFGISAQLHHFQSQVTAQSWRFYQSDLMRPDVGEQLAIAAGNPGAKPGGRQELILQGKSFNQQALGVVQRERLRVSGWVSPAGFLFPSSSMQLYGEAYVEWRRDFPRIRPASDVMCMLDKDANGVPEPYYSRQDCRVCQALRVDTSGNPILDARGNPTYQAAYGTDCGNTGGDRIAPEDYPVRAGVTVGVRDPTLYDNVTYDVSVTGIESWSSQALVARARVGAQAFDQLFLDMGFTYELSQNRRYYTSDAPYNTTGVSRTTNGYYPKLATSQAFVLDASGTYRVARGLAFDASWLMFFEEQPVVQEFIVGNGVQSAGVVGYIPRDQYQAQQLFLLRATYRM